ncbi:MAG: hypothetical protein NC204_01755 [Candidatus Amulumruptor caecigallinarius]|nr:hypothetical protein [Candidatus Amulumruptor caecigallinarius]
MKTFVYGMAFCMSTLLSCQNKNKVESGVASDTAGVDAQQIEYHADNDIAMTLGSIADALHVGEPLREADYDFSGVLTDGQGHPLYTNVQGYPGEWDVEVVSPGVAELRNVSIGDLLPADLERYITQSMQLSAADIIYSKTADDNDDVSAVIYKFNGGYMRIETRNAVAANGLEGPLMRITLSRKFTPVE